jgi:hypothetical protein
MGGLESHREAAAPDGPRWFGGLDRVEWTASDLADLQLPGMPATKRGMGLWLKRQRCLVERRPGPGGLVE